MKLFQHQVPLSIRKMLQLMRRTKYISILLHSNHIVVVLLLNASYAGQVLPALVSSCIAEVTKKSRKMMRTLASELKSDNCDKYLMLNKAIQENVDATTLLLENRIEEQKEKMLKLIKTFTSPGDDDDFSDGNYLKVPCI